MANASYAGRQSDLLVVQTNNNEGLESPVTLSFGDPSRVAAGIQKAAQWLLQNLLTRRGSVAYDPDFGTDLTTNVAIGGNLDLSNFSNLFNLASEQALDYQQKYAPATRPDDELITAITLKNYTIESDRISLTIQFETAAGTSFTFLAPIPVVPN